MVGSTMSRHNRNSPISGRVVPLPGRTFERSQGCWNCIHFDNDTKARAFWAACRKRDLATAALVAAADPRGMASPRAANIVRTVEAADVGIAAGSFGMCLDPKRDAQEGEGSAGDFVQASYLCNHWTGAQGASVARAGDRADDLPQELEDKLS